jgi:hypothetical protein
MRGIRFAVSVAVALSLTGCAFSDPRIDGTPEPWTPVAADVVFTAQVDEVLTAHTQAYAAVLSWEQTHPSDSLTAILATLAEQDSVLRGPSPQWRVPGDSLTPRPSTGDPTEALGILRDLCTTQASATTGETALLWASLAASAEQMRRGLSEGYSAPVLADSTRTVAILSEQDALSATIAAYHQAIFHVESSIGFVPPGDPLRDTLVNSVADLKSQRDTLMAYAEELGFGPVESRGIYSLPAQRDKDAALALVAQNQAKLVQAAGVWVASAPHPNLATRALLLTSTFGWPYGAGAAVWPGWPDLT